MHSIYRRTTHGIRPLKRGQSCSGSERYKKKVHLDKWLRPFTSMYVLIKDLSSSEKPVVFTCFHLPPPHACVCVRTQPKLGHWNLQIYWCFSSASTAQMFKCQAKCQVRVKCQLVPDQYSHWLVLFSCRWRHFCSAPNGRKCLIVEKKGSLKEKYTLSYPLTLRKFADTIFNLFTFSL